MSANNLVAMRHLIPLSMVISLNSIMLGLLCLASPVSVSGQTSSAVALKQMDKLDFLLGEWEGKGGMCSRTGSCRNDTSQNTKVKRGKNGLILKINDKKRFPERHVPGIGSVIHISGHPMVVSGTYTVYYDEGTESYYWHWESRAGRKNKFAARLGEPGVFQVKLELLGVALLTIKITDNGEWHERQDWWIDDKVGWVKMHESVLKKVK